MRLHLEPRDDLLLGLTGLGVLLLLVVRGCCLPVLGQMRQRQVEANGLRVRMADAEGLLSKLPEEEAAYQQARQRFEDAQRHLGAGQSLARILDALRVRAGECHLEFRATQAPPPGGDTDKTLQLGPQMVLHEAPVTLTLVGRYRDVGEFLASLREARFLTEVRALSMKPQPDGATQLEASITLTVYLAGSPRG